MDLEYLSAASNIHHTLKEMARKEFLGETDISLKETITNLLTKYKSDIKGKPEENYLNELVQFYSKNASSFNDLVHLN